MKARLYFGVVMLTGLIIAACGSSEKSGPASQTSVAFPGYAESSTIDSKTVSSIPNGTIFVTNQDLLISGNSPLMRDFGIDFANQYNNWYYGRQTGVCYLTTNATLTKEYILKAGAKLDLTSNWYDQRGGEAEAIKNDLQQFLSLGFSYDGNRLLKEPEGKVTFSIKCHYDIKMSRHSFRISELKAYISPTFRILYPDATILK